MGPRMSGGPLVADALRFGGTALLTALLLIACAKADRAADPRDERAIMAALSPPAADALAPIDLPGLRNVVAFSEGLYSGSAPDPDEGAFETLRSLGIRTIISVDGAQPEVELAARHGLRYVHLPISYNGMTEERKLEIARAVRDLPGPIYVHCHHGKHRSAGAAGAAAVTLGRLTSEEAVSRMKVSGAAPDYVGLYQCVSMSTLAAPDVIDSASSAFPERWVTTGMVQSMVEIDHAFEHLKVIEKSGWKAPPNHPDLVPAAEAGRLADLLRNLRDDPESLVHPPEFVEWLLEGARLASSIESGLIAGLPAETLSRHLTDLNRSCKSCHVKYRDAIVTARLR